MIFSSNVLKRWSFQKGLCWDTIFLVLSGRMAYFSRKHDIFSLGGKWETICLKKYMEIWYFLCTRTCVTNVELRPSVKKNQRWSYSAKIHIKVIDALDWYSRKSSSNSLLFSWWPLQAFSCIALQRKNPGNLIYRIEVWLLPQYIPLKIFYNE